MEKITFLSLTLALSLCAMVTAEGRPAGRGPVGTGPVGRGPSGVHPAATPTGQPKGIDNPNQQANLQKLQSDLAAIKSKSQVTDAEKQALAQDLQNIASGATKPSQESVQQLASDLSQALSDGNVSAKEKAQLTKDVAAVLNSANISVAQVNQAIADAQAILKSSGVTQADLQQITADLKAIAATAQANRPR